MNKVLNCVVVADPKAIAARRNGGKVVQMNVNQSNERSDAKAWRRQHGLEVNGPSKMKQQGFTLTELLLCIWMLFIICLIGGLFYAIIHFLSKFW